MHIHWSFENIRGIHMELSSLCNAACLICPRYKNGSESVLDSLVQTSITLEQFQNWFSPELLQQVEYWSFCGNVGDPLMAKDFLEIQKYILESNPNSNITVNTNGGIRSPEFWSELGTLFSKSNKSRRVVFSVDGLADTNHIYRRNVKWSKVLENMTAFCQAGGIATWDYLVFQHNEHQLGEAESLAKSIGIDTFAKKRPFGFGEFEPGKVHTMHAYNKQGKYEYTVWPASKEWQVNPHAEIHNLDPLDNALENKHWPEFIQEKHTVTPIKCMALNKQTSDLFIDAEGYVLPCCFMGTVSALRKDSQIYTMLDEWGLERISLQSNTLKEIIDSGYLNEVFVKKWNTVQGIHKCSTTCCDRDEEKKIKMHRLFVEKKPIS